VVAHLEGVVGALQSDAVGGRSEEEREEVVADLLDREAAVRPSVPKARPPHPPAAERVWLAVWDVSLVGVWVRRHTMVFGPPMRVACAGNHNPDEPPPQQQETLGAEQCSGHGPETAWGENDTETGARGRRRGAGAGARCGLQLQEPEGVLQGGEEPGPRPRLRFPLNTHGKEGRRGPGGVVWGWVRSAFACFTSWGALWTQGRLRGLDGSVRNRRVVGITLIGHCELRLLW